VVYYAAGYEAAKRRAELGKDWQQSGIPGNCLYKASPRHIFLTINNWKPWQSQIIRETTRNNSTVTQAMTHFINYRLRKNGRGWYSWTLLSRRSKIEVRTPCGQTAKWKIDLATTKAKNIVLATGISFEMSCHKKLLTTNPWNKFSNWKCWYL
jgi:hypothetical protein